MALPALRTIALCLISFVIGMVLTFALVRPSISAAAASTYVPPLNLLPVETLPPCPQSTCPQPPPALCPTRPLPPVPCACELSGKDLMEKGRPIQTPGKRMAMVVPFRDREAHLQVFSQFMHAYFKDYIDFRMFIVDQVDGQPFNRAMLMNIGYDISKHEFDYFCFHDVDLLPAEPTNDYTYPADGLRHLTVNLQNFKWETPSRTILGGITCSTKEHLIVMNGWSNEFWGWGAEDEDAYRRMYTTNYATQCALTMQRAHPHAQTPTQRKIVISL